MLTMKCHLRSLRCIARMLTNNRCNLTSIQQQQQQQHQSADLCWSVPQRRSYQTLHQRTFQSINVSLPCLVSSVRCIHSDENYNQQQQRQERQQHSDDSKLAELKVSPSLRYQIQRFFLTNKKKIEFDEKSFAKDVEEIYEVLMNKLKVEALDDLIPLCAGRDGGQAHKNLWKIAGDVHYEHFDALHSNLTQIKLRRVRCKKKVFVDGYMAQTSDEIVNAAIRIRDAPGGATTSVEKQDVLFVGCTLYVGDPEAELFTMILAAPLKPDSKGELASNWLIDFISLDIQEY